MVHNNTFFGDELFKILVHLSWGSIINLWLNRQFEALLINLTIMSFIIIIRTMDTKSMVTTSRTIAMATTSSSATETAT